MKRKRYREEQIAFCLRQHESGTPVVEIVRKMGISEQTFYRWKKKSAGMGVAEVRWLMWPVVRRHHDGAFYCVSNQGVLYALDAKTGKIEYRKQLEIPSAAGMPGMEAANIYGSLTMAGKHLLLSNDIGDTLVLAPRRAFQQDFLNYLDEGSGAAAVADGRLLLLRDAKKLYCIGSK